MYPSAAPVIKLYIRNMVCPSCQRIVRRELEKTGLLIYRVELGKAEVTVPAGVVLDREQIQAGLAEFGLYLLDDPREQLVEQIKAVVVQLIHYTSLEEQPYQNHSIFISEQLDRDYSYLSHQFSLREGLTLEKYIIRQRVERVKELLSYRDARVKEIAHQLGYSSAAHLTNQFRQVTGLTPTQFQALGPGSAGRLSLDDLL